MDFAEAYIGLEELPSYQGRRGERLVVHGGGRLADADCTGLQCRELVFVGPDSPLESLGSLLRRRVGPEFVNCDFSGLQVERFFPWKARFLGCRFRHVRVKVALATIECDIVGCTFSGEWSGNFSAGSGRRSVRVVDNDFTEVTGVDFLDGVDWRLNRFDIGGRHLILDRAAAQDPVVAALRPLSPSLLVKSTSLTGHGPIAYGQDWALLHRSDFEVHVWEQLRASLTSTQEPS